MQELANEINSLKETISGLVTEIQHLRNELEKNRNTSESLVVRLAALESAMDRG